MACFASMSRPGTAPSPGPPESPERSRFSNPVNFRGLRTSCEARGRQYREYPSVPVLGGWKTGNYWAHLQAFATARQNGFDEALVFNIEGTVISASMANVFFVFGGMLRTPAVSVGARRGVLRAWIKEVTHVDDCLLSLEDLKKADECFLTSSRLGVMPVAEIEGRSMPSRVSGEALAALYRERILGE